MKTAYPYITAALLIAYAVYSAFIPVTIAHSVILFSLAGIFAYNQYLLSRSTPKLEDEIAKLKSELEKQIEKQKEIHDKRLSELEGEITKLSLNTVRTSPSSKSSSEKKAILF